MVPAIARHLVTATETTFVDYVNKLDVVPRTDDVVVIPLVIHV